ENARLLLLSRLGNENDLVGRYFTEHATYVLYDLVSLRSRKTLRPFFPRYRQSAGSAYRNLAFTSTLGFQRAKKIGGCVFSLKDLDYNHHPVSEEFQSTAEAASIARIVKEDREPLFMASLLSRFEQAPNRDSRVMLSNKRDSYGQPRLLLDWRRTEQDEATLRESFREIIRTFGRHGIGRMRLRLPIDEAYIEKVRFGFHPSGTTRMAS